MKDVGLELEEDDKVDFIDVNEDLQPTKREFVPLKRVNSDGFVDQMDSTERDFNATHKVVDLVDIIEQNDTQFSSEDNKDPLEYTQNTQNTAISMDADQDE